ncbi:hypothetical protein ACDY96_24140 [Rhizobium mongolense]|uniref:hypothetical protein n=1 Tax=Rhizobium mongolense TaxID=57676 RepID=UPI00355815DD
MVGDPRQTFASLRTCHRHWHQRIKSVTRPHISAGDCIHNGFQNHRKLRWDGWWLADDFDVENPDAGAKTYQYSLRSNAIGGTTYIPVRQTLVTDEEGDQQLTRSYDVMGRLLGVRDPQGAVWTYT